MSSRYILIVNSRKVTRPVFVIGAPHSGVVEVGTALKLSPGFHVTMGQSAVLQAVHGFARRPSLFHGRSTAAVSVLRDAFAQAWQLTPTGCLHCTAQCRTAAGLSVGEAGPCAELRGLARYGDATPGLAYCAEELIEAFPDAQVVQVVRDGRDAVAGMLGDAEVMSWYRPSVINLDTEFPNPFYGVEDEFDRSAWAAASAAGKCALRWRWAIRLAARLRKEVPDDRLKTLRYEDMVHSPGGAAAALSEFTGAKIAAPVVPANRRTRGEATNWRRVLSSAQVADIEQVAGEELRRLGYADSRA
jgi:Sulfotransferase family